MEGELWALFSRRSKTVEVLRLLTQLERLRPAHRPRRRTGTAPQQDSPTRPSRLWVQLKRLIHAAYLSLNERAPPIAVA